MTRAIPTLLCFVNMILLAPAVDFHPHDHSLPAPVEGAFQFIRGEDWSSGSDVVIGDILFPSLHLNTAFGTSSSRNGLPEIGHHDPKRNGFSVQNLELGSALRAGRHFEGHFIYAAIIDDNDQWWARSRRLL